MLAGYGDDNDNAFCTQAHRIYTIRPYSYTDKGSIYNVCLKLGFNDTDGTRRGHARNWPETVDAGRPGANLCCPPPPFYLFCCRFPFSLPRVAPAASEMYKDSPSIMGDRWVGPYLALDDCVAYVLEVRAARTTWSPGICPIPSPLLTMTLFAPRSPLLGRCRTTRAFADTPSPPWTPRNSTRAWSRSTCRGCSLGTSAPRVRRRRRDGGSARARRRALWLMTPAHPVPPGDEMEWTPTQHLIEEMFDLKFDLPEEVSSRFPSHVQIYTLVRARGQGNETRMLNAVLQFLSERKSTGVHVDVPSTNVRSIEQYERMGFRHVPVKKGERAVYRFRVGSDRRAVRADSQCRSSSLVVARRRSSSLVAARRRSSSPLTATPATPSPCPSDPEALTASTFLGLGVQSAPVAIDMTGYTES